MRHVLATLLLLLLLGSSVQAHVACFPPGELQRLLEDEYGELPILEGRTPGGSKAQIWLNPETRSWTVVIFGVNNQLCSVLTGTDLEVYKGREKVEDDESSI